LDSWNHKALAKIEESLTMLQTMEVGSALFQSSILLKKCQAQSEMKMHEVRA
jgi:hypothetical protein